MLYVEAVNQAPPKAPRPYLFLAGGITNCPDWQFSFRMALQDVGGTLFNPRRAKFDVKDVSASVAQIEWEYENLRSADVIGFWFCKETVQPITLFELGSALARSMDHDVWPQQIAIGVDPGYPREEDVRIQTRCERPDLEISPSMGILIEWVRKMLGARKQPYGKGGRD